MSLVRVVGLGGPSGGDDRVGLEVVRWLTIEGRPAGCELVECSDPAELVELLEDIDHVVLVCAVAGQDGAGQVHTLERSELTGGGWPLPVGPLPVLDTIELAADLLGTRMCRRLDLVGITVVGPEGSAYELSTEVARAIPAAVAAVRACVAGASGLQIIDEAPASQQVDSAPAPPTTPAAS